MKMGLMGQKLGMTRIFKEDGTAIPVTVIEVKANKVSQIKTMETDGYTAIQIAYGEKKKSKANPITKPLAAHFAKAEVAVPLLTREFRVEEKDLANYSLGAELEITTFTEGQKVDVRAKSIGKGFAGTIKRHNFNGQRRSHGNSVSHRVPGSIGQNQTPGRVFKGKKMSGHMGNVMRCVQNLELVRVDAERHLLLVKGAIPGAKGGFVIVSPSVKA